MNLSQLWYGIKEEALLILLLLAPILAIVAIVVLFPPNGSGVDVLWEDDRLVFTNRLDRPVTLVAAEIKFKDQYPVLIGKIVAMNEHTIGTRVVVMGIQLLPNETIWMPVDVPSETDKIELKLIYTDGERLVEQLYDLYR